MCCSSAEAGGEARPADQETREAGPGGRQPGPGRRQRLAQVPDDEGDGGTFSTRPLAGVCQPAGRSFNQYCPGASSQSLPLQPQPYLNMIVFLKNPTR